MPARFIAAVEYRQCPDPDIVTHGLAHSPVSPTVARGGPDIAPRAQFYIGFPLDFWRRCLDWEIQALS